MRAEVRSDAATVAANSLMTCPDVCYQVPRSRVRSVVVLDVANSNSVAHRRKVGGTGRSRWPLPNVGQVSGQSSGRHEACVHKPSVCETVLRQAWL